MLLSFSLQNFRSFGPEQTLNLLASKRLERAPESPHCCEVPGTGEHALRVAALYGANGAGKSNLVRGLRLVKQLVLHGTPPGKPISSKPFLLDHQSPRNPTSFELQFLEDGKVFRYGVCYDALRVHEEWLDVYEGTRERNLFSRISKEAGAVTVELGPAAKGPCLTPKMKALAEVGARPNQLFLTEVVNLDDPVAQGPCFHRAVRWFASTLTVIEADAPFMSLAAKIATDDGFADFAGQFLHQASTGIARLRVETDDLPRSAVPLEAWDRLTEHLADGTEIFVQGPEGEEIVLGRSENDTIKVRRVMTMHDTPAGQPRSLPLYDESDGSRRLLHLLPALYHLSRQGGVFVIDELERSMHPMLARKFIEFFLKVAHRSACQLIFTTHETTLLDLDLLRRDGIWFAEKDRNGATQLYSLADFKVRKDLRIEKGYLEGRFGAVPFLGGIDHLMEEQVAAEAEG